MSQARRRVVAKGLAFPEGPCFDAAHRLYVSEVEGGAITRVEPTGQYRWVHTGGRPVGAAFHRNGDLYLANSGLHAVLRVRPDGAIDNVTDGTDTDRLVRPNDLAFGHDHCLYFTDPKVDPSVGLEHPIGSVYRLSPDGDLRSIAGDFAFSNGIAVGIDGALYVAETARGFVHRCELNRAGEIETRVVFAATAHPGDGPGGPDGMAFDAEGNLYVAVYGSGQVRVFDRTGRFVGAVDAGGPRPTNVAFGGEGRCELFITEAMNGIVTAVDIGVAGHPLWGEVNQP